MLDSPSSPAPADTVAGDAENSAVDGSRSRSSLDLLIWDAPNIDMTLSTVIGARPTAASRPRFDAIAAWFVAGAGGPDPADQPGTDVPEVEACVFANIPPVPGTLQRWVEALRGFGYAVFARPKTQPDDDIDQDMLDHIAVRAHSHRLRRLVVFSGDGRNFAEPLEDLARSGTQVVVVAFSEVAGYAISSDLLEFIDIEDVPGAFVEPLDRVRLDALPADGAWLRPTRSLRDFVSSYTARRT
ncbi:NYN domain-containing protein [Candidatus Blastococcus massiliensis]|uniref:NYN domain-containing protein n=1 Tax=Candidatus Blastococcus massiliensis TaxID=1470358 RepID=UPI0004AD3DB2|nr:NYN domain-containing protein [Candidatus Blastococcus massiliensis]